MTDDKPQNGGKQDQTDPKAARQAERQERLNAALRDNLKKRKRQVRARKGPEKIQPPATESSK
ncbi:MAG: hypothetical protein JKY27_07895 [Magnetovibrio sp.]|nr:hypothetical protein [Magnetovibrio sp.]